MQTFALNCTSCKEFLNKCVTLSFHQREKIRMSAELKVCVCVSLCTRAWSKWEHASDLWCCLRWSVELAELQKFTACEADVTLCCLLTEKFHTALF